MPRRYVISSTKFKTVNLEKGKVCEMVWREIPRDHRDVNVRAKYPGFFAEHPEKEVTFLFPVRKK